MLGECSLALQNATLRQGSCRALQPQAAIAHAGARSREATLMTAGPQGKPAPCLSAASPAPRQQGLLPALKQPFSGAAMGDICSPHHYQGQALLHVLHCWLYGMTNSPKPGNFNTRAHDAGVCVEEEQQHIVCGHSDPCACDPFGPRGLHACV